MDETATAGPVAANRAQYPNANTPWSLGEREQLADEVAAGWVWERIARKHGRTITAIYQQAAAADKALRS